LNQMLRQRSVWCRGEAIDCDEIATVIRKSNWRWQNNP
jgi:hypothetical protein